MSSVAAAGKADRENCDDAAEVARVLDRWAGKIPMSSRRPATRLAPRSRSSQRGPPNVIELAPAALYL